MVSEVYYVSLVKDNTVIPSTVRRPVDRSHGRNPRHRQKWNERVVTCLNQGSISVESCSEHFAPLKANTPQRSDSIRKLKRHE